MIKIASYLTIALSSVPVSYAWGALGHEVVAFVAQDFVATPTKTYVQTLLGSKTTSYMAAVATWADAFRGTKAGRWSEPLHFIDAQDDPPSTCNLAFERDCGGMCVVGAINNYTELLLDPSTETAVALDAIRFMIHFVGDIHQPLHTEGLDRGGNSIKVLYRKAHTNLHAVWDTSIPEELAGGKTISESRTFATQLTKQIKSRKGDWNPDNWVTDLTLDDPLSVASSWAAETNAFVCSDVLPDGIEAVENVDLSQDYFDAHNAVVSLQLARAGYRLAAWLDLIASASKNQKSPLTDQDANSQIPLVVPRN